MSILGFREGTFGRVRAGRMLAYRSNMERSVTATLRGDPGSSGVVMGPLRQASVFLIMSTVFAGRLVPYFEMTSNPASPFSISSLTSSTFWIAFKTVSVASTTSGPIPSPGSTAILWAFPVISDLNGRLDPGGVEKTFLKEQRVFLGIPGSVKSSFVQRLGLLSSTPGITVVVGFPFTASTESPCASETHSLFSAGNGRTSTAPSRQ